MDFRDLFGVREEEQQPQWTPVPSATEIEVPPPLPMRKDEAENEDRMNAINNALKNWDAAMKLREALQQPVQDNSPQAQNLRQAEEDLQQAKEEDAQLGSEGYEKKEDGIFSRMANWGSSVGDYLFGKDTRSEADKLADQVIQDAENAAIEREKEQKGVVGYYYGKLKDAISNEATQEKIGYYGKMANDTLETMARSPFSKFVDPTTLLGGQQTMVKDIDAYHQNRGIQSLRRELLEQDKARMGTTVGQAQEYARIMNDPNVPEEQKAAITQYMHRNAKSGLGAVSYPKTQEQAYLRGLYDFEQQHGRLPSRDEQVALANYLGAESPEAVFAGTPKKPTIKDVDDLILQTAANRAAEKGTSVVDELPGASQDITGDPNYLTRSRTYQSDTPELVQKKAAAEAYAKSLSKNVETINEGYFEDISSMYALLNKMDTLEKAGVVGGFGKETLISLGSKLGWTDDAVNEFLADFKNVSVNVHGNVVRKINQSGATNEFEQREAKGGSLDLSKGLAYNKQRLIGLINALSFKRARLLDEQAFMAEGGLAKDNMVRVMNKYLNLYKNIDKRIDPYMIEQYLYMPGNYIVKNGKILFQAVEEG